MSRIAILGRYLAIAGVVLGLIVWIWAALGGDRGSAMVAFAWCFIAAAAGIVLSIVFTPAERFGDFSPLAMKIAAIGFAIAAIPSAFGGLVLGRSDDELSPFFWIGGAVLAIGILLHGWAVLKRQRDGS
jgi:hypothetical protein